MNKKKQHTTARGPGPLTKLNPYLAMGGVAIPLEGKRPIHKDWTRRRYSNAKVVTKCVAEGRNVGWRIPDGVVVVDIDVRNGATPDVIDAFDFEFGTDLLANPRRVKTGGGGWHIFFKVPSGSRFVNELKDFPGIEFKGVGRQVVAAGSIHPDTGKPYEIEGDFSAPMVELAESALRAITRPEGPATTVSVGQLDQEQAEQVLARLKPEEFHSHDRWLKLMMAIHHATGGDARQEFIDWSIADPNYADQAEQIGRRWDSLHADSNMARITIGTLRHFLAEAKALDVLPPDQDAAAKDFKGEDDPDFDASEVSSPVKLNDVSAGNIDLSFKLVNINGKVRIVYLGGKSSLDKSVRVPEIWLEDDFKRALRNKFVNVESKNDDGDVASKRMPLASWWLARKERYMYDGLIFDSTHCESEEDEINLWRGFGVKENPDGDWSLMHNHIRNIIANGDVPSYNYIINWLAWAAQNPTKHCEVAIVFLSEEKGTGKGFLCRAMCRLFGSHGLHISNRNHLTGKFNAHFMQCGLLFCDEVIWPGHKEDEGVLKALITEPSLTVEPKGVNAYSVLNALKLMLASNEKWVVPASGNERRYAVFEVSAKHKQDHAYFRRMADQLDNGGLGAMLHDLLETDLEGWHPRQDIPQTEALARQKELTAEPEVKLMADILESGDLPGRCGKPNKARAEEFYDYMRKRSKPLQYWSDQDFAKFMKRMGGERKRSNGTVWVFPPLKETRARFREVRPWWPEFDSTVIDWESEFAGDDDG